MEADEELAPEDPWSHIGEPPPAPPKRVRRYRPRHRADRKRSPLWRELPVLVVIAFVAALVIKTFVLQAFYIPSASMEPTLREGDRVVVEKIGYLFAEPGRGDVIVFERRLGPVGGPEAPRQDEPFWVDITAALKGLFGFPTGDSRDFIKRVIAVGGDTIESVDGRVVVNGRPILEPYLPPGTTTSAFGPTAVPDGMLFVMGDNRGNSDDSRSFGPIPVADVIGHAFLLVWPPSDFSTL